MTRSNRILNRLALALLGLLAVTIAALLLRPEVERFALEPLGLAVPSLGLADLGSPALPAAVLALAVVAVTIALVWTLTRGRGADGTALDHEGVTVDATLVEALLRQQLEGEPEVLHVRLRAFQPRRVLLAEVQVRRGADLAHVHERVRDAAATADELLGDAPPLVAHITTGLRSRFAGATRTH